MAKFGVSFDKESELAARMSRLGIREQDIEESFIKGSGSGGQKINKTSSCVQLRHRPSGIEVRCQRERSQALNRFLARRMLCDRVEQIQLGKESAAEQARERIRRQKRRRSRKAKEKMLRDKAATSQRKKLRGAIRDDD